MKYLKIDNNKGYYTIDGSNWIVLDEINKDHLMELLNIAINNDFEMDKYDLTKLANQAHQIIYKNIYDKFNELCANKQRFKDESESIYKDAIYKYRGSTI